MLLNVTLSLRWSVLSQFTKFSQAFKHDGIKYGLVNNMRIEKAVE